MKNSPYNYSIFFDFIESYLPSGFQEINAEDPIMQQLEKVMKEHDQFLSVIHVDQIKHLYTSRRSKRMLGIDPTLFNGAHFLKVTHPDEQLLNMGQLYSKREFEIIKLIESGKAHISELIYELKEQGILS